MPTAAAKVLCRSEISNWEVFTGIASENTNRNNLPEWNQRDGIFIPQL